MSLRLAMRRSQEESGFAPNEVLGFEEMLRLCRSREEIELKRALKSPTRSPYFEFREEGEPGGPIRKHHVSVSRLIPALCAHLLSIFKDRKDPYDLAPVFWQVHEPFRVLCGVLRTLKEDALVTEDFIDDCSQAFTNILLSVSTMAFQCLLTGATLPPSSDFDQSSAISCMSLLQVCFDSAEFIYEMEVERNPDSPAFLNALIVNPNVDIILSICEDLMLFLLDEDNIFEPEIVSQKAQVSQLLMSIVDFLDVVLLCREGYAKFTEESRENLLYSFLYIFQDPGHPEPLVEGSLRVLYRLVEDDSPSYLERVLDSIAMEEFKQIVLVVENFITQSLENGTYSATIRYLALRVFEILAESPVYSRSLSFAGASIVQRYLSVSTDQLKLLWSSSEAEYVALFRLIAYLYLPLDKDGKKSRNADFLERLLGPNPARNHLLKKALTAKSIYLPNFVDNLSQLLYEILNNSKLKRFVSHAEAKSVVDFKEELSEGMGRKSTSEMSEQVHRMMEMLTGFRVTPTLRGDSHTLDGRKKISLGAGPAPSQAQPPSPPPLAKKSKIRDSSVAAKRLKFEEEEEKEIDVGGSDSPIQVLTHPKPEIQSTIKVEDASTLPSPNVPTESATPSGKRRRRRKPAKAKAAAIAQPTPAVATVTPPHSPSPSPRESPLLQIETNVKQEKVEEDELADTMIDILKTPPITPITSRKVRPPFPSLDDMEEDDEFVSVNKSLADSTVIKEETAINVLRDLQGEQEALAKAAPKKTKVKKVPKKATKAKTRDKPKGTIAEEKVEEAPAVIDVLNVTRDGIEKWSAVEEDDEIVDESFKSQEEEDSLKDEKKKKKPKKAQKKRRQPYKSRKALVKDSRPPRKQPPPSPAEQKPTKKSIPKRKREEEEPILPPNKRSRRVDAEKVDVGDEDHISVG